MKYRTVILCLASLINLTIERSVSTKESYLISGYLTNDHLKKSYLSDNPPLSESLINRSIYRLTNKKSFAKKSPNKSFHSSFRPTLKSSNQMLTKSITNIPIYLIEKPINRRRFDDFALESANVAQYVDVNGYDARPSYSDEVTPTNHQVTHINELQINPMNPMNPVNQARHINDIDNQMTIIDGNNIDTMDPNMNTVIIPEDQMMAKRLDELNLMRKLGGLTGLTSLLSTSQRRISPLNKIILGLLGPRLIKLQLDMMFGAVISELVRKLVMPVVGFVIDKNLPMTQSAQQMQPQVPYANQIEQIQNAYASLSSASSSNTTPAPQNYVNHPSYYSPTTTPTPTDSYTYYGQAQLANYLASQPQLTKSSLSSQDGQQVLNSPTGNTEKQSVTNLATNQQLNQMNPQQLSQQLNLLIKQFASSINQQAQQQTIQSNFQNVQPTNQLTNQLSTQLGGQSSDQNNQIYAQLQNLILEQVKLKNQLQQLTKPKNYFAKDMQLDGETKEGEYQADDEASLKDAPLNEIEQEYDRAQRWNTVLKNMDHFYSNNDTSSTVN